jgi:hypothetical protein
VVDEYRGPSIYSRVIGGLCLLPASGLAGGSLPLGNGGRSSGGALVQPPGGETLSSTFVEQAKQSALGPPALERRQ